MTRLEKRALLDVRNYVISRIKANDVAKKDLEKFLPNELDCFNCSHYELSHVLKRLDSYFFTPGFGEYDELGVNNSSHILE